MIRRISLFPVLMLLFANATTLLPQSHPVPPAGIAVPTTDEAELRLLLKRLEASIAGLRHQKGARLDLIPDVEIFYYAAKYALDYHEFFKPDEIQRAKGMLQEGEARADLLSRGEAPWTTASGLIVRGYVSKIDGSVQPYGLVVPADYTPQSPHRWRLDTWFHGRNETLSELNFLYDRTHNKGEFTPESTIVLHLYGRYCNANKFAGEVDLFEALDAVKKQYRIDENRILVRGFSMGGAAAWHIATHYAGLWAAAAPGAGFAESAEFLDIYKNEKVPPTDWEKKLWHLYDATDYAVNLAQCPTLAYSGEIDKQRQAAEIMARSLAKENLHLAQIIGPQTAHKYHPDSKVLIDRELDAIAERGRDPYPSRIRFVTYTLAYNRMKWVTVDALAKHWEQARIEAAIVDDHTIRATTANINAFTLQFGPGGVPLDVAQTPVAVIDGQRVDAAPPPLTDRSWTAHFRRVNGKWQAGASVEEAGLHKVHALQGPIDDAFLDRFVMVRPTGQPMVAAVAGWVASEQAHAIREWRRQFRGEAIVKDDSDISDADIASSNLILWGDPGSNKILARIADRLPIRWSSAGVSVGGRQYPASHAPVLIYPNPLNPKKYIVLNSGFTYREYDYLNNARQVPKLPDHAIVDTTTPPDDRWPGKVIIAGFFDEYWRIVP